MAEVEFTIDDAALWNLVKKGEGTFALVSRVTDKVGANANALSAGYRTGLYYVNHKSPPVGNTQPRYGSDTRRAKDGPVGIVYTGNYAAMKDNHLHNTLLKSF